MKQITDKLNKIAKAIDENVEIPTTDLITDSLDAITRAYGGTPNDSKLIVDKLDDIASVASGGSTPTGTQFIKVTITNKDTSYHRFSFPSYGPSEEAPALAIWSVSVGDSRANMQLAATYEGYAMLDSGWLDAYEGVIDETSTGIERVTDEHSPFYNNLLVSDNANIVIHTNPY